VDRRLLDLYNRELAHLRAMGAEFAKEFPKIAGRLGGLDEFQPCQDPFVAVSYTHLTLPTSDLV